MSRRVGSTFDEAEVEGGAGESAPWLATLCDIMLLLLVFFILLVSFVDFSGERIISALGSIKTAMGGEKQSLPSAAPPKKSAALYESVRMRMQLIEAQKQTFNEIRSFLVENSLEGKVGARLEEGRIVLELPAQVLFAPKSVELSEQSRRMIDLLKDVFVLRREQNIDIRGYTDDVPVTDTSRFVDNWELSTLRAVAVLRYLIAQGIEPDRLTATGYGALNPLVPNTSEANRARNRRVEFVLQRDITKGT